MIKISKKKDSTPLFLIVSMGFLVLSSVLNIGGSTHRLPFMFDSTFCVQSTNINDTIKIKEDKTDANAYSYIDEKNRICFSPSSIHTNKNLSFWINSEVVSISKLEDSYIGTKENFNKLKAEKVKKEEGLNISKKESTLLPPMSYDFEIFEVSGKSLGLIGTNKSLDFGDEKIELVYELADSLFIVNSHIKDKSSVTSLYLVDKKTLDITYSEVFPGKYYSYSISENFINVLTKGIVTEDDSEIFKKLVYLPGIYTESYVNVLAFDFVDLSIQKKSLLCDPSNIIIDKDNIYSLAYKESKNETYITKYIVKPDKIMRIGTKTEKGKISEEILENNKLKYKIKTDSQTTYEEF